MAQKESGKQNYFRRFPAWIERLSSGRLALSAGILFALSLLPLLLLGRYNVMCIDDYNYGTRVHDVWLATGSLRESAAEAWRQNRELYGRWQGTYVSCFLMAMCPMNFRYELAWTVPVLMIGLLSASAFCLGRHVLIRWLGCERRGAAAAVFLVLFGFYQVMEAPFEGIYWYNGATHYVLMQSLWFFQLALLSETLWAESGKRRLLCCVLALPLAVIVAGGNLVTALQAEILMAALAAYTFWKGLVAGKRLPPKKIGGMDADSPCVEGKRLPAEKRNAKSGGAAVVSLFPGGRSQFASKAKNRIIYIVIPFITGTAGFLVNVLAPGNGVRAAMDVDEGYGALPSIFLSFYNTAVFAIRWTPLFVALLWLALLPFLWKMAKASERDFSHPLLVTAGALCLVSAMFTPTLFAVGMTGLSRVDNIIQITYYLAALLLTVYWMGHFAHREKKEDAAAAFGLFLERAGRPMSLVCVLLLLALLGLTGDKNTYTSVSALRSLARGEGQTFYAEAMERHALYTDDAVKDVTVSPYSERPHLFSFQDLSENPGNWLNQAVAAYYHKTSVRCVEESAGSTLSADAP